MKFLVIPILVGLLAIGLISGGIYNIYIHKRYMNCLKYGKKSNGIIINKIKHETNMYPYASLKYSHLNHKLYENNILNWFTVYVKYKGEDGNEYASFFSAPCADDVGASIPILIYKNYATWDKDSFAIPKGEKILICSCGCKLNKNDITCPSCGKEV